MESKGIGNVTLTFTDVITPPTPPTPGPDDDHPEKGSNAFWIILIIIVVILFIGGIAIYVFVKGEKEPNMSSFVSESGAEMIP